jgi:nucleotide-binding universal stress UspA family protein
VHAYLPEIPLWLRSSVPPSEVATPEQDTDERAQIDRLVAPWSRKYADVPVETILSHDSAAAVLVGVSHGAQLIVVGSHGRGPVADAILGSTGAQLLRHADCPVLLTRPLT